MKQRDMKINRLPVRTWNHLGMNDTRLAQVYIEGEGRIEESLPKTVRKSPVAGAKTAEEKALAGVFQKIKTGMGEDMEKLAESAGMAMQMLETGFDVQEETPVKLRLSYEEGEQKMNVIGLHLLENSALTVIMDYVSEGAGRAAVQTKILAEKGAKLCLVQLIRLGSGFECLNDMGAICKEGSEIEVIQLILSGKKHYLGCLADLEGRGSAMQADIGYLLKDGETLDMNYVAINRGEKSESRIYSSGALRKGAGKLFRGTIDFKRGAVGAKGDEREEVLLLEEDVSNQSIPLILCEEEDVEGNHGVTAGKLDEELLFYLETRGIGREQSYELMAMARVGAVIKKIREEETRRLAQEYLAGKSAESHARRSFEDHCGKKGGRVDELV